MADFCQDVCKMISSGFSNHSRSNNTALQQPYAISSSFFWQLFLGNSSAVSSINTHSVMASDEPAWLCSWDSLNSKCGQLVPYYSSVFSLSRSSPCLTDYTPDWGDALSSGGLYFGKWLAIIRIYFKEVFSSARFERGKHWFKGKQCSELVKEVHKKGTKYMLFIGK